MELSRAIHWFILFFIALVFYCGSANGQGEANHWFFLNFHLNFNGKNVNITPNPIPSSESINYSSISDMDGNLLFVTNREGVYNKNLTKMPNGDTGFPSNQANENLVSSFIIIPQPSSSLYYIFMSGVSALYYVVVDMSKNGGLGDVIQKAKSLPVSIQGQMAAAGNCNRFWLFAAQYDRPPRYKQNLLRFEINEGGLSLLPDTIKIADLEMFNGLKFSPDGKKLVFNTDNNSGISQSNVYKTVLCDFDLSTGNLSNRIIFFKDEVVNSYEFSPDCSKLYTSTTYMSKTTFSLHQFDISVHDSATIENSKILIHQLDKDFYINDLALSPLGQIVCEQSSTIGTNKSAIIRYPNKKGLDSGLEINALNFYIFVSTNFVSTFLSPQFDENFDISAGESAETCSKSRIVLGETPTYDIEYSWLPTIYLDKPKTAGPTFLYSDTISVKTDFQYILDAKKGYCHNIDTVTVTVYPDLQTSVLGSKSVCPGVTEVDYWAEADERFRFDWSAAGGDIVAGQSSDSIKINWGPSNPNASVSLTPYNELNCPSDPIIFPVHINVELQTETPIGEDLLCANLGSGIPYGITNTNGSIYTWESDVGKIISGQGSNKINVDWPGDGKHKLWVKEQSTTIDTVCYGVSDSLLVNLYTDSTKIEIDFASVSDKDPNAYELQWYVSDTAGLSKEIDIFSSSDFSPDWELINVANKKDIYYTFPDTVMNYAPLSFKISSVNGCRQLLETEVHTTIFLEGIADSSSNKMTLIWTPYQGWNNNIDHYEIWYAKDKDSQFSLVDKVKSGQTTWSNHWGDDAFLHHYRIRAMHSTYPFESWSNELTLSFEHSLEIPNVFTPNSDGINDTFSFPELELFRENELTVIDRYGKEVFTAKNYDGHWNGAGLASGTYYYSFQENHYGKNYKGWIRLLR